MIVTSASALPSAGLSPTGTLKIALVSSFSSSSSSFAGGAALLVLRRHRDVDLVLRRPRSDLRLRLLKLGVDDRLELVEGLRARERHAVDEERGRSVDAGLLRRVVVVVDLRVASVRGETALNFTGSTPSFLRPLLVGLSGLSAL